MALPAALLVTMRLAPRPNIQGVERYRFQAVGLNVAERKIRFRHSDKARAKIAAGPDDSESLTVITAREAVERVCVTTQDCGDIRLVL